MSGITDLFDQALTRIAVEIQNRQVKVSDLERQKNYLDGEINGLRTAQDRIEQIRGKVPKVEP